MAEPGRFDSPRLAKLPVPYLYRAADRLWLVQNAPSAAHAMAIAQIWKDKHYNRTPDVRPIADPEHHPYLLLTVSATGILTGGNPATDLPIIIQYQSSPHFAALLPI